MTDAAGRTTQMGGYKLLEEIGRGAMGVVYRAQSSSGEEVAIKVANAAIADSPAETRFENEALLTLRHPNLVRVLDSGTEEGTAYLVYNLLEGESVEQILRRGPMPTEEVVAMGVQMCSGLAAAHAAGVVHRDIKPANIMRSASGHYTLIDFGLAQWEKEASRLTIEGQVLGTPSYLPPEQARGAMDIDGRSDIWSLGVVLYEAASGVCPFAREATLATILAVVMDEPADLGEVAPHTSPELQVSVMRALRKEPRERWPDVEVFSQALQELATRPDYDIGIAAQLSENERRLVVVLLAENLLDAQSLGHAVVEMDGLFLQLGDDRAVGIFGGTSSQGDELVRATQVGLDSLGTAKRLAVASGYSTGKGSVVSGATLASAQAACELGLPGVSVDPASARALAGRYDVQARNGGHQVLASRDTFGSQDLLIGRDLELAQVLREVERVAEEREPGLVLIRGQRGIGKTCLLRNVEAGLSERVGEAVIFRARASASNRDTALSLAAQLMAHHFADAVAADAVVAGEIREPEPVRAELIEAVLGGFGVDDRTLCADFLAELIGAPTRESVQIQAARLDPQLRKDQIHYVVRTYLMGLAAQSPVYLVVDDLQWCDTASVQMLAELFGASAGLPLGIIGTALPENEQRYAPLFDPYVHSRVDLRTLSRMQVARLAEAIACQPLPETVTTALAKRTHGNPLFVEQLVRDMYAGVGDITEVSEVPLPLTVEVAVQSHLDNLGGSFKELCKRASVFTHAFSPEEVHALGVPKEEGLCDWLVQQGVLSHAKTTSYDESRYLFRSNLVAEVAYGMLLEDQRRTAHLKAGHILSKGHAETPENIARHFILGGSEPDGGYWYFQAAQGAKLQGDSDTVLRCSALALEFASGSYDFELLMTRSDTFRFMGRREEQADTLEQALAAAGTSGERARAMTEFAWNLSRTGNVERALKMAEAAVDAGRDAGDQEALALALGWRAVALGQLGRLDDSLDALGEATQTAKTSTARVKALAADWRAQVYGARGDLAQRLLAFVDAEVQYMGVGDVRRAAGAACNVADLYNRLGDFSLAENELRQAREGCRRVNNRLVEGYATANLGYALIHQGRNDEAITELDYALALATETNETVLKTVVGLYRCRARLMQAPPEDIVVDAQHIAAQSSGLPPLAAMAYSIGSSAALLAGDVDTALSMAAEAMSIRDRLGGIEEDEAELFVVLAKAQEAVGNLAAAAETRRRGAERVAAIADDITSPQLRETFLAMEAHAQLLG